MSEKDRIVGSSHREISANNFVICTLERFFYRWGKLMATYPLVVIVITLTVSGLCCIGFKNFRTENDAEKLWLPRGSHYLKNKEWKRKNWRGRGGPSHRYHVALITHEDNIMTPEGMRKLLQLSQRFKSLELQNLRFPDFCALVPITDITHAKKRRRKRHLWHYYKTDGPRHIRRLRKTDNSTADATDASTELPNTSANIFKPSTEAQRTPKAKGLISITTTKKAVENVPDPKKSTPKPEATTGATKTTMGTEQVLSKMTSAPSTTSAPSDDYNDIFYEDYIDFYDGGNDKDVEEVDDDDGEKTEKVEKEGRLIEGLPTDIYCDIVETFGEKCGEYSPLEMWKFDEDIITNLTQQEIVDAFNTIRKSPVFGYGANYASALGDKVKNKTGHVIAAKTVRAVWVTVWDVRKRATEGNSFKAFEWNSADPFTMRWEGMAIKELKSIASEYVNEKEGYDLIFSVSRSFSDVTTEAIEVDTFKLLIGFALMFCYTMFMLGKLNAVEHRTYLAMTGLMAVGLGIVSSIGITMLVGLYFTTMHGIMPFLCLGVGIDDMFVILQCWNNLAASGQSSGLSVEKRVGMALQHAGVAITVTSVTNVLAFGVGAATILPGLQVFCVTSAMAIAIIFTLQCTWFIAWLALDQRRIEAQRDGFVPCVVRSNFVPPAFSQTEWGKLCMGQLARLLEVPLVKVLVLLVTGGILVFGAWGSKQMKVEFDPFNLTPADSYVKMFKDKSAQLWPSSGGWGASIWSGELRYDIEEFERLEWLTGELNRMRKEHDFIRSTGFWWDHFKKFLGKHSAVSDWRTAFKEGTFRGYLSDYLHHKDGARNAGSFTFGGELRCNEPAPPIKVMVIGHIGFAAFSGAAEHIHARAMVEGAIKDARMTSYTFSDSNIYSSWETDEVIARELWRNLGLAMASVFVVTFVLLVDFKICLMVLSCVALSLIDVVGVIHFWGLTIDTISCISVVLVIGLCIDYSAHIGHAFIVSTGTKSERASNALTTMGPAILNGGVTTVLALSLLGFSKSYAYIVFFKVFLSAVMFGLFHGLILLPVILSIFGSDRIVKRHQRRRTTKEDLAAAAAPAAGMARAAAGMANPAYVVEEHSAPGVVGLSIKISEFDHEAADAKTE